MNKQITISESLPLAPTSFYNTDWHETVLMCYLLFMCDYVRNKVFKTLYNTALRSCFPSFWALYCEVFFQLLNIFHFKEYIIAHIITHHLYHPLKVATYEELFNENIVQIDIIDSQENGVNNDESEKICLISSLPKALKAT